MRCSTPFSSSRRRSSIRPSCRCPEGVSSSYACTNPAPPPQQAGPARLRARRFGSGTVGRIEVHALPDGLGDRPRAEDPGKILGVLDGTMLGAKPENSPGLFGSDAREFEKFGGIHEIDPYPVRHSRLLERKARTRAVKGQALAGPCWCALKRSARLAASHPLPRCPCGWSCSRSFSRSACRSCRSLATRSGGGGEADRLSVIGPAETGGPGDRVIGLDRRGQLLRPASPWGSADSLCPRYLPRIYPEARLGAASARCRGFWSPIPDLLVPQRATRRRSRPW